MSQPRCPKCKKFMSAVVKGTQYVCKQCGHMMTK